MSNRFFISEPILHGQITLSGAEAHHLSQVRRFQIGETVTLFSGDGNDYLAVIESISKKHVVLTIEKVIHIPRECGFRLELAIAFPKGDRLDFLLEKCTELGVTDLIPLQSKTSVVIPKEEKREKWERAVIEASKQCGRNCLMQIHPPTLFSDYISQDRSSIQKFIAHPTGKLLSEKTRTSADIAIVVGPEGGFTDSEIQLGEQYQWEIISLGQRILRIETAAMALSSWAIWGGSSYAEQ